MVGLQRSQGAVHHEKKSFASTFHAQSNKFENKPSRRLQFLNILSCSRDIHILEQANES